MGKWSGSIIVNSVVRARLPVKVVFEQKAKGTERISCTHSKGRANEAEGTATV